MPEYLTPGVYVEETSFRAKSIEGVGTSTTGFAGPTRKGPVGDTPELITSFGDFERVYGGFDDLSLSGFGAGDIHNTNYVAHAVRNFFDNGGSRLYVARVFAKNGPSDGTATAAKTVDGGGDDTKDAQFVSRFPGAAGNGKLVLTRTAALATTNRLGSALDGTMLRVGTGTFTDGPAIARGGGPTFNIAADSSLFFKEGNNAETSVKFTGTAAKATSDAALVDPIDMSAAGADTLAVTINGTALPVKIVSADMTKVPRASVVTQIGAGLGAAATVALDGANKLVITTTRKGKSANVKVTKNAPFGFAAGDQDQSGTGNVADLSVVTVAEVGALLPGAQITASGDKNTGTLILTSVDKGASVTMTIQSKANSAHAALGLTPGDYKGTSSPNYNYFLKKAGAWADSNGTALDPSTIKPLGDAMPTGAEFVTLSIQAIDADNHLSVYEDMGFHSSHPRYVGSVLNPKPQRRSDFLENLFALKVGSAVTAFQLMNGMFTSGDSNMISLTKGDDGGEPGLFDYSAALDLLGGVETISIIAAPGHSVFSGYQAIQGTLIAHAEARKAYRIAVLDTRPQLSVGEAERDRSNIDSTYAALYYPWVIVSNPLARPGTENVPKEIALPPSGFVTGIYARTDVKRGVFKAPANEVVTGALRFQSDINFDQQAELNPAGVNCLRFFSGRGYRVWGARTVSSDPEWKYVNVRRYFIYLEASIDRSTQWAVFEPNGENLWANIRDTVDGFLYNEWKNGALLGTSPKEAYFVRCDRSTMTQNDLDNGRLICLIGVAVIKPAEFVIFRIGQKTADARS